MPYVTHVTDNQDENPFGAYAELLGIGPFVVMRGGSDRVIKRNDRARNEISEQNFIKRTRPCDDA